MVATDGGAADARGGAGTATRTGGGDGGGGAGTGLGGGLRPVGLVVEACVAGVATGAVLGSDETVIGGMAVVTVDEREVHALAECPG